MAYIFDSKRKKRRKKGKSLTMYKYKNAQVTLVGASTTTWSQILTLSLRQKLIDFYFLNNLKSSYSCKSNNILQLFWLQTSLDKTPKILSEKWKKSVIFDRKNKYKNKRFPSRISTSTSWKSSCSKQKVATLLTFEKHE